MILNTKNDRSSFSLPHSGYYRWMKFNRIVYIYILSIISRNISFNFFEKFLRQRYHFSAYDYISWLCLFVWWSTSATYSFPCHSLQINAIHSTDVRSSAIGSQITSLTIVYSTVYSGADQRKHQSSVSLAFVREFTIDRWIPRTNGQ